MLGFSLNPLDWMSSGIGWFVETTSNAVFEGLTNWVESALSWFAKIVAEMVVSLSAGDFSDDAFGAVAGMFRTVAITTVVCTIMVSAAGAAGSRRHDLGEVLQEVPRTLVMMAAWSSVCAIWLQLCRSLTEWALADTLQNAFSAGLSMDAGIASFFRFLIALVMLLALIVFAIEMLFIGYLAPFAVAIGPIALALRPWPDLRDTAKRMVMNMVMLTMTPFLVASAMSLAMRTINNAGVLDVGMALKGMVGMLVAVLMPGALKRFIPLEGSNRSLAKAMMGAAAAVTAAAATVATAGAAAPAAAAAAGGGGGQLQSFAGGATGGGGSSGGGGTPGGGSGGGGGSSGGGAGGGVPLSAPSSPGGGSSGPSGRPAGGVGAGGGPVPSAGDSGGGDGVSGLPSARRDQAAALMVAAQAASVLGGDGE